MIENFDGLMAVAAVENCENGDIENGEPLNNFNFYFLEIEEY